ncbi:MAG: B12-binding domain-containing radical SAM protein [Anaerolineae bacterium]|nr:B12-binding domain-containing radical SAM protein [Anaerolineae bacterium]
MPGTDLLLVNPLFLRDDPTEAKLMTPYFPLGLLYVAAVARQAGYAVAIFDAMFAGGDADFVEALERHEPRVVGFGVLATVRRAALRLAALAKSHGATVLVGGPDPTARPDVYLRHQVDGHYVCDVVAVGEAEAVVPELLAVLLASESPTGVFGGIPGIAYRDVHGDVVENERCALIEAIDGLPLPARDLVNWDPYRNAWRARHGVFSMSLIATRGCPFGCAWCQKIVFGRSFRPRDPVLVADEMRHIKEAFAPDFVRIVDDAMGIRKAWVKAWRDAVLEKDAIIPFECLSRVDLLDADIVRWLKEAGCRRIALGAESGSQRVLDAMAKGSTVAQIHRAATLCRQAGIETYLYMMVGYPTETWEDLKLSAAMLRETLPDQFSTTIAYPLPGTAFHEAVKASLPQGDGLVPDWDFTAENRLLFGRGEYSTFFYRRVIRWFHHEWEDAWIREGRPVSRLQWVKTRAALWRDRVLVHLLARMPGLGAKATGWQPEL